LIRKPKPERQSVRKPNPSSPAAPGAASSSLALFDGRADLGAGLACGAGIPAPKELKHVEKLLSFAARCCIKGIL